MLCTTPVCIFPVVDQALKRLVIEYLRAVMDKTGRDATNLARAIGMAPSTMTRHLDPAWEGGIASNTLRKAEKLSGLPIPPGLAHARKNVYPGAARSDSIVTDARPTQHFSSNARDSIPVRSAARGGDEQEMFLEDGPVDYVPRPHVLDNVKGAYALYMLGDSMSPKYEPGYTLYVNPFKPPRAGRGVVIFKKNNAVLVKLFKSITRTEIVLEQLNPRAELRIDRAEVDHVHLIVHVDED